MKGTTVLGKDLKTQFLEEQFADVIKTVVGEDYVDPHLSETPRRLAESWLNDYFWGIGKNPDEVFKRGVFDAQWEDDDGKIAPMDQVIHRGNIPFISFCAHHFVPFVGKAFVSYMPHEKIVGISKIGKVIDILSHRPQVQERLGEQIADSLFRNIQPKGLGVYLHTQHFCTTIRGRKEVDAWSGTTALRGNFLQDSLKQEFLSAVGFKL